MNEAAEYYKAIQTALLGTAFEHETCYLKSYRSNLWEMVYLPDAL
jgi:hypothetical protein